MALSVQERQQEIVEAICDAYESGYGHALRSLPNPYHRFQDEYYAYNYGKMVGTLRVQQTLKEEQQAH